MRRPCSLRSSVRTTFAIFASLSVLLPLPAFAYDTPEALIRAVYAPYLRGDVPENPEQFRSESLQGLYDAAAENTEEGEIGAIAFDPVVNGQDFEITDLEIVGVENEGDTATVEVSFRNFDVPNDLVFSLVEEKDGWKVDDVASVSGEVQFRLTDIFRDAGN